MATGVGRKNAQAAIPQNYICKLALDLTTQLFIRVHPQDLLSCNRVCKHWNAVFQQPASWQHFLSSHFSSIKTPETEGECEAAYKAEYRRRQSNPNKGNFCLKPYVPFDKELSFIFDSDIGKVKAVYNKKAPDPAIEIYDINTGKLSTPSNLKIWTSLASRAGISLHVPRSTEL